MAYLKTKDIVHGDLSSRNVLVSIASNSSDAEAINNIYIVQVADFGLAKIVNDVASDGSKNNSPTIPIKWAAIELVEWALYEAKKPLENMISHSSGEKSIKKSSDYYRQDSRAYTAEREAPTICEQTDVWSLGVLIWEILNYGESPYFKLFNKWKSDALERIKDEEKIAKLSALIDFNRDQNDDPNKHDETEAKFIYYVYENFYEYLKGNGRLSKPTNSNGELWTIMTLCNNLVLDGRYWAVE